MQSAVASVAGSGHPSGDKRFRILDASMKRQQFRQDALIEVLHRAQDLFGFLEIDPANVLYCGVRPPGAGAIVAEIEHGTDAVGRLDLEHPFFTRQLPIVLENSGRIDPERIEEYIAEDGYQALGEALMDLTPADIVRAITESGLRGRGGAGYPTGLKWGTVAKMPGVQKYVVCNGDEGDPGAFMDRSVMESDPHRILEGMAIAGYAVGATQGFIYVRAEYPVAVVRLNKAIQQAKRLGVLGSQVMGSPFDFRVEVRIGAGAFVCGEETALMASIKGRRRVADRADLVRRHRLLTDHGREGVPAGRRGRAGGRRGQ